MRESKKTVKQESSYLEDERYMKSIESVSVRRYSYLNQFNLDDIYP